LLALETSSVATAPEPAVEELSFEMPQVADSQGETADALFADFDFTEIDSVSDQSVDTSSNLDVMAKSDANAFDEIIFDFDEQPSPADSAEVSMGLDDFLAQHAGKPLDVTVELPVPASIPTLGRRPAVDVDQLMSNLSFELAPVGENSDEAAQPAVVASAAAPGSTSLASEFDAILSSLSLQPMQDEPAVSAAPNASSKSPVSAAATNPFSSLSLELEPVELEVSATADFAAGGQDNPFASLEFGLDQEPTPTVVPASARSVQPRSNGKHEVPMSGLSGSFSRVWVLGASIGGPDAVREFLSGIPRSTNHLFLLAQHMGADFLDLMVSQLAKATPLEVKMAASGSAARPGQVLVVPLAERLLLAQDGDVRIVPLDEASPYSPSIDQVLFDAADRFGARAGVIIFSGMAHDAIEGAKYLASKGGTVWAQDPATCVVSSMIDGAVEAGIVRFQGGPSALAQKFVAEFG
jgi:chemotaxis response regulator CheB